MKPTPTAPTPTGRPVLPFSELHGTGMLWLINTTVFHPRGMGIALVYTEKVTDEEIAAGAEPDGWTLLGDRSEAWTMGEELSDLRFPLVEPFLAAMAATPEDDGRFYDLMRSDDVTAAGAESALVIRPSLPSELLEAIADGAVHGRSASSACHGVAA